MIDPINLAIGFFLAWFGARALRQKHRYGDPRFGIAVTIVYGSSVLFLAVGFGFLPWLQP